MIRVVDPHDPNKSVDVALAVAVEVAVAVPTMTDAAVTRAQ
jgi:hypothetical protein